MNAAFAARALYALAAGVGRWPWRWQNRAGDALGNLWLRRQAREARVARRNLELALPALGEHARAQLLTRVLRTTGRQFFTTLSVWTRPSARMLALIEDSEGVEWFDAALASGKGLIICAPHHGNWELLNRWLSGRTPISILYRPPDSTLGEAFLRRVRASDADAARVTQVRAEGAGMRQLYRTLGAGGVVGILPDQQPKAGDGEFAPFFGVCALSMTLVNRLAMKTGAAVLFACCERMADAANGRPRFRLVVQKASSAIADADARIGVAAMNQSVEAMARRDLAQYQWTYKRFTLRPPGSGEVSPYADFERQTGTT